MEGGFEIQFRLAYFILISKKAQIIAMLCQSQRLNKAKNIPMGKYPLVIKVTKFEKPVMFTLREMDWTRIKC